MFTKFNKPKSSCHQKLQFTTGPSNNPLQKYQSNLLSNFCVISFNFMQSKWHPHFLSTLDVKLKTRWAITGSWEPLVNFRQAKGHVNYCHFTSLIVMCQKYQSNLLSNFCVISFNFMQSKCIIGPVNHVEFLIGRKNINLVNIPTKFTFNWSSGFGECWNIINHRYLI
jgi:hypothetical protein